MLRQFKYAEDILLGNTIATAGYQANTFYPKGQTILSMAASLCIKKLDKNYKDSTGLLQLLN